MRLQVETADDIRIIAESEGAREAPALLFLNSIGCTRRLWDAQTAALHGAFRCLTYDARGHGGSDAPDGDYTIEQLGRDALAVLDTAGVPAAHVCGLSLGGLVGQWLGVNAPERVMSLTLANTASRIGTWDSWETRRRLVLLEGMSAIAETAMERFFSDAFRTERPELVAEARAGLLANSAVGYAGCCAALRDADLTGKLGRIAAPTLVIGGERDVSTPPDKSAALARAISGTRLEILPAAHLSNLEQPEAFTAALRAHLETA
ncbi:MAG TPA: 3-oxoadipate enol-lactonase [Phenylobacterium sp.]|uniref:3-oxoadipate enol-lactonase n=1 Tax=Phenylobacterium sp. TaxID=1871053 RepID=UPI002B4876D5|nr:3-oxoadipate enol-lactonase [Phenylobacterium sp.]HKR25566.1 3-oxoadipate enol-lactonase [Allosphingosinicella sp.]HKR89445.1 3-oxoadipate enol-lactonase [Phenylobacterium sp.]